MRIPELERVLVEAAERQEQPARWSLGITRRPLAPVRARWQLSGRLASGIGALAALGAVIAVLVVTLAGAGTATAFAGWSATPTPPASGQLQAAESDCANDSGLPQGAPSPSALAPTLTDTRGPFSLLVYTDNGESTVCVAGLPHGTAIFSAGAPTAASVAAGAIQPQGGAASGLVEGQSQFHLLVGQAGLGVTGVALVLDDGSSIEATTGRGWFAAWWPGSEGVQSASVTTVSGTATQPLNIPALYMRSGPGNVPSSPTGSSGG
jgi:hypothetical protein